MVEVSVANRPESDLTDDPARAGHEAEQIPASEPGSAPPAGAAWQPFTVAFGFASLLLAALANSIVGADLPATYHWSGEASKLFAPLLLLVSLFWIALGLLLFSARRQGRWRLAVWTAFLLSTPWVLFRLLVMLWGPDVPRWCHFPPIAIAVVAWIWIMRSWRPVHALRTERIIASASTLLDFVAVSGVVVLVLFLHSWRGSRPLNDPRALHPQEPASVAVGSKPRVIWIILDELSFDQVFPHRYPGLQLPAFDALAAQSTVFTHVIPAGNQTERVVPALLTGKPVDKMRASLAGDLRLHNPATGTWSAFDQHATVFQDALNDGYRTGVAGWYNPYCRILPAVLMQCAWTDDFFLIDGVAPHSAIGSNLMGISGALLGNGTLRKLLALASVLPAYNLPKTGQMEDYRTLLAAGDRLLADPSSGFVLLHMPFPHPPGYFDRVHGTLTTKDSTYVDNLALSDRYLAHVRALLEQSGQWNGSTVLVMGDHSWRTTTLWRGGGEWTGEEERASAGGHFDDRPAYLLKLAGQTTGQRINTPFAALNTRSLLDALLDQRIRTAQDLAQWVTKAP